MFKYKEQVINHFWKRSRREYLLELRSANFTNSIDKPSKFKIGDVVLLHEDKMPNICGNTGESTSVTGVSMRLKKIKLEQVIVLLHTTKNIKSTKIKSEARELVESFPITNENYPLAIESLTERYGRKELLIDFYVRELLKLVLNNATKKKQDSLSSLYNKLSTQLRALSSLGVTTDQCGVILYPLVESSLPTHILRSFERQRKNIDSEQSISTLDAIVPFLKSEVQSEEKIKLSRSEILPYERECKHLAESQSTLPSAAELFIQESRDTCAFCFKVHANRFCKRAFFIPLEEKIAIIKKKGLCRVCLAKGHLVSRCRSQITCQLCSKRHLKLCAQTLHVINLIHPNKK
ncbi:integrase catalytic domain-containing protein [Nephila pilipes]|uniref:Integrase catalytic domain-containing protein n=1 Tax=Nephila pilipes TaxID=299642 RepID=A0A8X6N3R7_NEPPI|nr:integrase catalytic domain-containing protein [Nephila pilipes]